MGTTTVTKIFDFTAPEFISGQWIKTRRFGTAKVLNQGFQMQTGTQGYVLEVLDSNHYSSGEVITVSRGSVRHYLNDIVGA